MRRSIIAGVAAGIAVLLSASVASADSAAGAPPDTQAGRDNAALAQALQPFGQTVSTVAHVGLVDDLTLVALRLTPPRR